MAITIAQKPNGTTVTFDRGKWQASSAYVIRDDAGAQLNAGQIMSESAVNNMLGPDDMGGNSGALKELDGPGTTGSAIYFLGRLRQVGFDLKQVDDGGYVWEAVVHFDSSVGDSTGTITPVDSRNEGQPSFVAIEYSVQGEPVDIWRNGSSMSMPSNKSYPAENDISGTKVDSGGEPISSFNNVARVTVRNVLVGRPTPPLGFINRRNSNSYSIGPYSFPADTLLFTGCNISRVGSSTYEIVYSFAYDEKFHLRQVAQKSAVTGEVEKGGIGSTCADPPTLTAPAGNKTAHAVCVYWRQPFPDTIAFPPTGMFTS
jgi:hypothetical protein